MPMAFRLIAVLVLIVAVGCGRSGMDAGPFGDVKESKLLAPFAGRWTCDFEKTIEALKAGGATDEKVESLRKFYRENPELGNIHPDIELTGDVAVSSGIPSLEYRFFALHKHDGAVCGKAWHHEDRFDPGDMSKCYVRLRLKENCLHLDIRMHLGEVNLNDPDLAPQPAESGSAAECNADHPPGDEWDEWMPIVFTRK
jgi:hypothetical protein